MTQPIPIRAPMAVTAIPGMELDPVRPGFPRQVIVNVEWDNGTATVTTTHGTWKFDRWDLMTFPRRVDGSAKDWNKEDVPPRPFELCVMDILSPAETPPRFPNEKVERMWKEQASQIVTGIWMNGSVEYVVIKTFTPIDRQLRMWHFGMNELVRFPRTNTMTQKPVDRNRLTYGPYVLKAMPDVIVEFYVHPSGKGRWPNTYREFWLPEEPGTYRMQPPRTRGDWKKFVLVEKGVTHPNDPLLLRRDKVGGSVPPEYARD